MYYKINHILRYTVLWLLLSVFLSGCSHLNGAPSIKENSSSEIFESSRPIENSSVESSTPSSEPEILEGLVKNEYEGLSIAAELSPAKVYNSGETIPIKVSIANTGDQTVLYTLGSSSYTIPEALQITASELQPVLPRDWLGISTRDYRIEELPPSTTLTFTLYLKAITPNESFHEYSRRLYQEDTYIADLDWQDLSPSFPDLTLPTSGLYQCEVYFIYHLEKTYPQESLSNSESFIPQTGDSTGYAKSVCRFSIQAQEDS